MYEKKHILVVDDDIRIRKLIQKYLRKNDYLVSTASNAHEAIKFANIIDFDLLIICLLYTSPSPRDVEECRMPSSA